MINLEHIVAQFWQVSACPKMLPSLKVTLVTVILITLFESYDGGAARTPQVLKWESRRNYLAPGSELLEKSQTCSSSSNCPPWFICHDTECQCGPTLQNAIICDETMMISAVIECYCVTEVDSTTYAGYCFYNCGRHTIKVQQKSMYSIISNKMDMNEQMCGPFNRTGISCGKCKPGLSPFVLSYNLSCVECPDSHKNWWKFALCGFAPLTLLYFTVIFFNVNITSSRLHGYVLFSQALSTPAYVRIFFLRLKTFHGF